MFKAQLRNTINSTTILKTIPQFTLSRHALKHTSAINSMRTNAINILLHVLDENFPVFNKGKISKYVTAHLAVFVQVS